LSVHSLISHAIDVDRYGDTGRKSGLCGKRVQITNTKNGKVLESFVSSDFLTITFFSQSVTVTVADACPTCQNGNSIDLSRGAFTKIATESEGEVPSEFLLVGSRGPSLLMFDLKLNGNMSKFFNYRFRASSILSILGWFPV